MLTGQPVHGFDGGGLTGSRRLVVAMLAPTADVLLPDPDHAPQLGFRSCERVW